MGQKKSNAGWPFAARYMIVPTRLGASVRDLLLLRRPASHCRQRRMRVLNWRGRTVSGRHIMYGPGETTQGA